MFTKAFQNYVCEGDNISCEVEGFTLTATVYRDDCGDRPDERDCGFWPSLDPQSAGYIGPKSATTLRRHMAKAKATMEAWERDEWFYCGVAVTVEREGVELTPRYANALWGVECNYPGSDNSYLRDVANELASEALEEAKGKLATLCRCEALPNPFETA
jgi:hypothetical protein